MEVPRPAPHAGGEVVEAFEPIDDEVDNLVRAIDAALDEEEEDAVAGGGE